MHRNRITRLLPLACVLGLAACRSGPTAAPATPTSDPAILNQVPDTTVYEPGQCTATLDAAAPSYSSSTLGQQPSGEVPAGKYEVAVAAQYSTSLWYMLNSTGTANYVNSTSVSSTTGDCSTVDK
jgi:hypothetical protein